MPLAKVEVFFAGYRKQLYTNLFVKRFSLCFFMPTRIVFHFLLSLTETFNWNLNANKCLIIKFVAFFQAIKFNFLFVPMQTDTSHYLSTNRLAGCLWVLWRKITCLLARQHLLIICFALEWWKLFNCWFVWRRLCCWRLFDVVLMTLFISLCIYLASWKIKVKCCLFNQR